MDYKIIFFYCQTFVLNKYASTVKFQAENFFRYEFYYVFLLFSNCINQEKYITFRTASVYIYLYNTSVFVYIYIFFFAKL
jgi:hypothetical protein